MEEKTVKVNVKFLKSPTGKYKLAYNAGDIAEVEKELADAMVSEQFAVIVESEAGVSANNDDPGGEGEPDETTKAETAESKIAKGRKTQVTKK